MAVTRADKEQELQELASAFKAASTAILVDYRGFDTLGEISVLMAAGIAIMALLRSRAKPAVPPAPAPRRRRKAAP